MTNKSPTLVNPFPPLPNPKDYEHLSEEEKMTHGFPHRPIHEELANLAEHAGKLIERFNKTSFDDERTRREILDVFLHPSCKGKNIFIEPTFRCDYGYNLKVGINFYANCNCRFLDSALIEFGDDCRLEPGVQVYAATHPLNAAYRKLDNEKNYFELALPIKIGNNCLLGGRCIICPGVTLGNNVVVAAGAVVTKSFPDNVVVAGNPARVIKHMPEPEPPTDSIWKRNE